MRVKRHLNPTLIPYPDNNSSYNPYFVNGQTRYDCLPSAYNLLTDLLSYLFVQIWTGLTRI